MNSPLYIVCGIPQQHNVHFCCIISFAVTVQNVWSSWFCFSDTLPTLYFHRCGRTDKGVSAFDQVISITLRSKVRKGIGVEGVSQEDSSTTDKLKENENQEEEEEEINYVQLLNRG